MVRQGASGALLLSFPFIHLLLIDTGVCIGPNPIHYFLLRCRWFLRRLFLLFLCLYILFSLAVYFNFFTTAAFSLLRFLFPLEADPEQSVFSSFLPSWKSSSFRTAVWTASSHSLPSGIGSIMDNLLTASSGIWSSIIFLKTSAVTLTLRFQLSISNRHWSMSPLYLTFIICRSASPLHGLVQSGEPSVR